MPQMPQMPMLGNMMGGQMGGMGYSRPRMPQQGQPRSRVCRHWERGNCQLGDSCGFLHTAPDGGQQHIEPKKSYSQNNNSGTYQNNNSGYSQNNNSEATGSSSAELTNAKLEIERLQNQLAYAENEKKKLEAHTMGNQY
jgi:hypothetical protein